MSLKKCEKKKNQTTETFSCPLPYSWWALVSYGVLLVTLGAFIFGQTTANAVFVDLLA